MGAAVKQAFLFGDRNARWAPCVDEQMILQGPPPMEGPAAINAVKWLGSASRFVPVTKRLHTESAQFVEVSAKHGLARISRGL